MDIRLKTDGCCTEAPPHRARVLAYAVVAALLFFAFACMAPQGQAQAKSKVKLTTATVKVTGYKSTYYYTGKKIKPSVKVYVKKGSKYKKLKKGKHYSLSYANNKKAGTATIRIKGKKTYKGTIKKTFKIRYSMAKHGHVTLTYSAYKYANGETVLPTPTVLYGKKKLKLGRDYKLTYTKCRSLGTAKLKATGKGLYKGSASTTYEITNDLSRRMTVKLSSKTFPYSGQPHMPDVTVTAKKTYEEIVEPPEPAPPVPDETPIDDGGLEPGGEEPVDGEGTANDVEQESETRAITRIVVKTEQLVEGVDYKIKVKNNTDIGTATVTVTGKGQFKGSKTVKHFSIKEPATKIIDVSFWDGQINWSKTATKVSTVFMRAFRTLSRHKKYSDRKKSGYLAADTMYDSYATSCEQYGIAYSAYAYLIFTNAKDTKANAIKDAKYQADRFWKTAFSNGHKPIALIIDVEDENMEKKHASRVAACTEAVVDRLQYRARKAGYKNGIKIGLYGGGYQFDAFGFRSAAGQKFIDDKVDFLWIARYGKDDGKVPDATYRPDEPYDLWQYTSKGSIAGVDGYVDLSLINAKGPNARTIEWYLER